LAGDKSLGIVFSGVERRLAYGLVDYIYGLAATDLAGMFQGKAYAIN